MGLDLYLSARLVEKSTNRCIPTKNGFSDDGFFDICCWCGWEHVTTGAGIINICNKHLCANFTADDVKIPVPESALRDIYRFLTARACLPEGENIDAVRPGYTQEQINAEYELENLRMAENVRLLMYDLRYIADHGEFYNTHYAENFAPEVWQKIKNDPRACRWEFEFVYS